MCNVDTLGSQRPKHLRRLVSTFTSVYSSPRVHYREHITDSVSARALAGAGRARVTGRARRPRSASGARGTRRAPCTQALVSSRAALLAAGVRATQRPLQLLHQPAVELVLARRSPRASRALAGAVGGRAQRGARGRRAAVRQRAHGGRAAVRAQRVRPRRQRRALRARLRHLAHAPAQRRLLRRLRRAPRALRVVDVPVVLHYRHHERHLDGGDGDSCGLTFLEKFRLRSREKLSRETAF